MERTDDTIEIQCGECPEICVGIKGAMMHILNKHPQYTHRESVEYAELWMESAYQEHEAFDRGYVDDRKLDRAIHADMEAAREVR